MKTIYHPICWLACAVLLSACASNSAIQDSKDLQAQGHLEESVQLLDNARQQAPDDLELRAQYFRQRDLLSAQLLGQADTLRAERHLDAARAMYERVRKIDVNNPRVREGLIDLDAQERREQSLRDAQLMIDTGNTGGAEHLLRSLVAESPSFGEARRLLQQLRSQNAPKEDSVPALKTTMNGPLTLEFRDTPLKTVFDMIARSSGLNFVFDKDVRTDTRITLFVRNTSIEDIVKLVLTTNQLARKQLNENTLLIYPNTPVKIRDYVDLVTRSFYMANTDVKQAQNLIKTVVKTKDLFIDEKLNLLIMKDTPDAVRLAERLIEQLDIAEPEVMLELEVLEISRGKLQELGLRFPDQIGYGLLTPTLNNTIVNTGVTQSTTTLGGALAPGNIDLSNTGALTTYVANPGLLLNLKDQDNTGNILANPRIRVKNREKAKIHIGDKLPVFTTTSTANVGVAASVSYLDVGLKLDVEPNVYLNEEVGIKIGLEVSSVVKEVTGAGGSSAYQIGSRSAETVLRLKDGETQVLAGLINDEERSSANRVPGLGDIPILGRLFSSQQDSKNKTEIILLVTPHIVRNLIQPQDASSTIAAGSEGFVGASPMTVGKSAPHSLSIAPASGGAAGGAANPIAERLAAQRATQAAAAEAAAAAPAPEPAAEAPAAPDAPAVPAPAPAVPAVPAPGAAPQAPQPSLSQQQEGITAMPPSSIKLAPIGQ